MKKKSYPTPYAYFTDEAALNNVPAATSRSVLKAPDFQSTDPSEYQGFKGENICFPSLVGRGEGKARGVVTHVPETLFGNNEVSGEGRDRRNNLFAWAVESED